MARADTSKQAQLMEVLKKEVRSLLVAAKEGLTPAELERDYMAMIGKPLPVRDLGFRSALELVENMPEVVRVCPYEKGTFILRAIADENTKMIAQLVAKQRCSKSRKGAAGKAGVAHPPKNPQRVRAPILPVTVKAQLQDLLSSSPLLLVDFEEAFFRRFGRAFQYKQYGFFSLFEVLKSVSDIVVVEQTRAGSLLTLKKCMSSEIETGEMPQGGAREEAPQGEVWEEAPRDGAQEEALQGEVWEETPQRGAQEEALQGEVWEETPQREAQEEMLQGEVWEEMLQGEVWEEMPQGGSWEETLQNEVQKKMLQSGTREEVLQSGTREEMLQNEVQKKMLEAAPAAEMAPLEPICETEIFHLTAGEKSESVETQAVNSFNGFKQPQDLEPSLLAKLMAPEIPLDAVQDRSLCSLPPLERRCLVGVFVEFVVSPSQFYVRICSRENSDQLQDMMVEMRHCYSNKLVSDRYIMPESSIQPGQLCCVTVLKWWYRVIIHRVVSDQEVEVFYPDYGNLDIVRKSCLRFLKWCYLKLPAQAIPCSLAWVKPVEDTWSSAATLLFKKLCSSKLLVGIVDEYVNGILHLFLCDTSTKEDVYFHSVLRDGGCAQVCGENIPSQGFKELNPSALYIQPSGNQENDKLVEPDPCLQQESIDAVSETASSKLDGDEPCDQQWHLPAEETQDDVLPLLEEVGIPRTTDQDPELAQEDTNEALTELMAVVKTPHSLGESSVPAVLFKSVEDFYTSFTYSEQPAEMSQDDPGQIEGFSNKVQLREAVHPSVLLMAAPFMLDNHNNEEKMKSKDVPGCLAVSPYSSGGLSDQGPSQKLYVPPTTLSTVLAAARLATSRHYFQWLPSLRKKV